jgi:hypothetical protein
MQKGNMQSVQSVVCRTIGEVEDFIEEFGPAGYDMLRTETPIRSYKSGIEGIEFMWSAADQLWYVSELDEGE